MAEPQTARTSDKAAPDATSNGSSESKTKSSKVSKRPASKPSARQAKGRRRGRKPYPIIPFEQALRFGEGVGEVGAGHPVKRATLLDKLKLTVTQSTKDLITASNKYGITKGSHDAEEFSLTAVGTVAAAANSSAERNRARIKLAITDIEPFKKLYDKFRGGKMPAVEAMRDTLEDLDLGDRAPCVDIFLQNAKFVGVLQTREGAEYFVNIDDVAAAAVIQSAPATFTPIATNTPAAGEDYDTVCFFIAPIGKDDSEHRKHSDAILSSYVERALATVEPKLRVVRADKITQPGMITKQVLEYLLKSRLVVADLSYHNPNVFYELAVRHATGKPVIHIKRTTDAIPFDNKDFRTIDIPFEDKFEILAQIETVRSSIAQSSRQSLAAGDNSDNTLLIYFPDHRFGKVGE